MSRSKLREAVQQLRVDTIVSSVHRLLAEKGFDSMTVDEVAADAGIAKASLYKHFASKEALAAAAMVRVLQRCAAVIDQQAARDGATAIERLKEVTAWALREQLEGRMPALPSQNSTLRAELMANKAYLDLLMQVSDRLGAWIVAAQTEGALDRSLPPELVLYTLYARACDPVPAMIRAAGTASDDQIVALVIRTCFDGLATR
jgi:AcrR family transcriptional regulator